ncbi:MAG: GST-like protein [Cellvibrionaceae bacterium]|jgi:GST-like protein
MIFFSGNQNLSCVFGAIASMLSLTTYSQSTSRFKKVTLMTTYTPPRVWAWDKESGGKFASINRPVAGATHEAVLPQGDNRFQLYSMATPNGVKATILFEELLDKGIKAAEYDAYLINISEGDQFGSGFVDLNPNSKIPALIDTDNKQRVFESGSILVYLAELFGEFLPQDPAKRTDTLNWLFWQMGSAPFLGGGFGHFYSYAPEKYEYPIERFAMETKRQLDVLDKQLARSKYIAGDNYTIADMAIWPWYGALVLGKLYDAAEFLDVATYTHVLRWANEIAQRPAVQRGEMVNRFWGQPEEQLPERHGSEDFKK